MRRDRHDSPHRRQRLRVVRAGGVTRSAGTGRLTQLRALLCPAAAGNAHTAVGCESSDTRRSGLAALVAGDRWRRHCQPERGGSSRLAALLCPAAAGKGHAAVGCEASDATIAIGCAADSVPASGAGWPRHWEAPSDERGGSSRLAFTSPLGCCRCGRRRDAVGRELIEGKIGSVAAAHFPSSLPFPFTPSHPSEN